MCVITIRTVYWISIKGESYNRRCFVFPKKIYIPIFPLFLFFLWVPMHAITVEMIMELSTSRMSPTKTKNYSLPILQKIFKMQCYRVSPWSFFRSKKRDSIN